MNYKKYMQIAVIIIFPLVFLILIGCAVEKNVDFQLETSGVHSFESEDEHSVYLASTGYNFGECIECHGDDLHGSPVGTGGSLIRSCYECHARNNHLVGFGQSTGHDEYLRGSRWDFTSCYNCHLNSNTSSQVNFGGSCSSSSCHNSELGGAEACNTCHGNFGGGMDLPYKWAPPSDLQGEIQTTNRGVGAHQTHLRAPSGNFLPVTCTSCHTVPSGLTSEGHLDSATPGAEVIFSELAAADSVDPNYDNNELTCSVYCHGESNPIWTEVNGSWNECNSCHDYPTDLCNTQSENCGECHSRVMDLDGNIISPELHLNGRIEID